jgi:hypothetical protein
LNDTTGQLEDLDKEIKTNLIGPIQMIRQFLPQLKRQQTAAIENVSSGLAFVPLAVKPIYCATKAAVHSYTQSHRSTNGRRPSGGSVQALAIMHPSKSASGWGVSQDKREFGDVRRRQTLLRLLPSRWNRALDRFPHHPPMHAQFPRHALDRAYPELILQPNLLEQLHLGSPVQLPPPDPSSRSDPE